MDEEDFFGFELRRYLLQRDGVVITREYLAELQKFENLAAARSDRDQLRAALDRVWNLCKRRNSEAVRNGEPALLGVSEVLDAIERNPS
jgi:hypothetical protein